MAEAPRPAFLAKFADLGRGAGRHVHVLLKVDKYPLRNHCVESLEPSPYAGTQAGQPLYVRGGPD